MYKSHLSLIASLALAFSVFADHHGAVHPIDREIHNLEEKFRSQVRQTQRALHSGELTHEAAKEKMEALSRSHGEKRKELERKRMRAHLDREVKAGRLSSEEADRRFEEMKERSELKDRVTREIHREMEEEMETVMGEAQEGELTEEEAREEIEQMRMHFQHEIRMAHMEIELDAEESRLDEAVADGRLSEDEMEERMVKMQERMERAQDEFHQRLEEDGHDRDDHHEEHSHWEDEEELWARVADGLKAAVRLGRMSEGEAREIWEEWREEAEFDENEEEYDEDEYEEED